MLKQILTLTKLYLKSVFNFNTPANSNKKKRGKGMIILFAFLGIYFAFLSVFLSMQLCNVCKAINQSQVFLAGVVLLIMMMSVFSTFVSSANVLYFSKDNEYIFPLPIQIETIISAKLNNLLLYDYLYALFIGLIPLITYGIIFDAGVLFYINAIIIVLITPILPTVIISLLIVVIMSFTKNIKNKSIFQAIGAILMFGFSISISLLSNSGFDKNAIISLISQANGLVEQYKNSFIILKWSIELLTDNSFLCLLLLILTNLLVYLIFILISSKIYLRGAIGTLNSGTKSKHKFVSSKSDYSEKNIIVSYVLKEIKTLIRKPIYITQCVLPSFLLPIIMFVSAFFSINSKASKTGMDIKMLKALISLEGSEKYVYAWLLIFILFSSMFVFVAISAVSRDGSNATFMKYVPLKASTQIFAKAIPDMIFSFINSLVCIILAYVLLEINYKIIIYILVLIIPYSVCHGLLNILVDLYRPKLSWLSEIEVVKNNLNTLFTICFALVSCLLVIPLFFVGELNNWVVAYPIFYIVIARLLIFYIIKKDSALLDKIY